MATGTWALDWAVGDVVTKAEFRKSLGCVADQTLGVAAASFDFSGLPTTYAHLLVVTYLRSDDADTSNQGLIRLNGDSGSNYDVQYVGGSATTASAFESFGATAVIGANVPGAGAAANLFAVQWTLIPHYGGTANNKALIGMGSWKIGTASGNMTMRPFTTYWRSSAAVSRITVSTTGNLVAGSRASIYVMGS